MAVEIFEGFDTFTSGQLSRRYPNNAGGYVSSPGAYGVGQYLGISGPGYQQTSWFNFSVTPRTEYYVGFDINPRFVSGNAGLSLFLNFYDASGSNLICTFYNANNNVQTTFGGSAGSTLPSGIWQNFQVHLVTSSTSSGILTVKVNGSVVLNVTGFNTSVSNIGIIQLSGGRNAYDGEQCWFDNFWAFNTLGTHSNTWPVGYVNVQVLAPLSDGTFQQWQPDFGTAHYSQVNALISNDGITYNYDINPGDMDTYGIGSLTGTISQVHAVEVSAVSEQDLGVVTKEVQTILISGPTLTAGPASTVTTSWKSTTLLTTDDPNTGQQWTITGVDAIEAGVRTVV